MALWGNSRPANLGIRLEPFVRSDSHLAYSLVEVSQYRSTTSVAWLGVVCICEAWSEEGHESLKDPVGTFFSSQIGHSSDPRPRPDSAIPFTRSWVLMVYAPQRRHVVANVSVLYQTHVNENHSHADMLTRIARHDDPVARSDSAPLRTQHPHPARTTPHPIPTHFGGRSPSDPIFVLLVPPDYDDQHVGNLAAHVGLCERNEWRQGSTPRFRRPRSVDLQVHDFTMSTDYLTSQESP